MMTIISALIMQLVTREVNLSDKVEKYIPEVAQLRVFDLNWG